MSAKDVAERSPQAIKPSALTSAATKGDGVKAASKSTKRIYGQACVPCHTSKLGCDGARPCGRCSRGNKEHKCVSFGNTPRSTSAVKRRRAKSKTVSNGMNPKEKTFATERKREDAALLLLDIAAGSAVDDSPFNGAQTQPQRASMDGTVTGSSESSAFTRRAIGKSDSMDSGSSNSTKARGCSAFGLVDQLSPQSSVGTLKRRKISPSSDGNSNSSNTQTELSPFQLASSNVPSQAKASDTLDQAHLRATNAPAVTPPQLNAQMMLALMQNTMASGGLPLPMGIAQPPLHQGDPNRVLQLLQMQMQMQMQHVLMLRLLQPGMQAGVPTDTPSVGMLSTNIGLQRLAADAAHARSSTMWMPGASNLYSQGSSLMTAESANSHIDRATSRNQQSPRS